MAAVPVVNVPHEAVATREPTLLEIISRVVSVPGFDPEKLSRLLDLQERVMDDQRKTAFMAAMARLQAKMPQINKDGHIVVNGQERSRYMRLEDLDFAVRPLLAEEGFSFSFNEESADGNSRRYSARLSHRDGHSETKFISLPLDVSGSKNAVQAAGSTAAYAQRYLIQMHLNIVAKGVDIDGHNVQPITADQSTDLQALAEEVKADKKRFLSYMNAASFDAILAVDYQKAVTALQAKARK